MTLGRLSLGPASAFACLLRVRLVCGLALLGLTVPLPLLDCPSSVARLLEHWILQLPAVPGLGHGHGHVPRVLFHESAFGQ
jgi:hypothetical protein